MNFMSARDQRNRRLAAAAALVLIVAAGGWAYARRQDLRDDYQRWRQGPLPPALTVEEIRDRAAQAPPSGDREKAEPLPGLAETPPAASPGSDENDVSLPSQPEQPPAREPAPTPEPAPPPPLPKEINLKVPMVYQAPLGNWDALHEDACEEAAMLMLQAFLGGEASLTREEMERRIQDLIADEENMIGFLPSIDAQQAVEVMAELLGIDGAKVLPVGSIDDVRRQLADGHAVILPASGKELGNPNFRNGGPLYHMLVAKGYTATRIITNDPGTRKGADYLYDPEVLFDAVHDWNEGDVPNGAKVMIVAERSEP